MSVIRMLLKEDINHLMLYGEHLLHLYVFAWTNTSLKLKTYVKAS